MSTRFVGLAGVLAMGLLTPVLATASASEEDLFAAMGRRSRAEAVDVPSTDFAGCTIQNPGGFDLDGRISWGRRVIDCLEDQQMKGNRLNTGEAAILADVEKSVEKREAQRQFLGVEWGMGVGVSHGFSDTVDDAEVVNGIVRVKRDTSTKPRLLLEFHRFFFHPDETTGKDINSGHGPFVAVAGSEDSLASVGAGWMWGWKSSKLPANANAFTFGVGVVLDLNVKSLGDGIRANQPMPEGETQIRFKEKSRPSLMLVFTRSFD